MNLPFTLPDWLPAWAFLLLALPLLLWALAFVIMPFSVFGVKARLEAMESQIEALHEELRMMSLRASGVLGRPAVESRDSYDTLPNFERLKSSRQTAAPQVIATPPIPPAPVKPVFVEPREKPLPKPPLARPQQRRMEPKLD